MELKGKWLKGLISKVVSKILRGKLSTTSLDFTIQEFEIADADDYTGNVVVNAKVSVVMPKKELEGIIFRGLKG